MFCKLYTISIYRLSYDYQNTLISAMYISTHAGLGNHISLIISSLLKINDVGLISSDQGHQKSSKCVILFS